MASYIEVGPAESRQRLLRFIERRLGCPRALIYKWLRGGEVRVNGGRAQADYLLAAGDIVRLPPRAGEFLPEAGAERTCGPAEACPVQQTLVGADLKIIFQDTELLVLNKPAGLPVQGGTGLQDNVADRLKKACSGFYVPAPAHRLDLHASGVLLAGKTYRAQTFLHGLFREAKGELEREYFCWAAGDAMRFFSRPALCADMLTTGQDADGRERTVLAASGGKEAKAWFQCLEVRVHQRYGPVSLVRVMLLTGRKHQIRVQLAARGLPLLGDGRYGGPTGVQMLLHAARAVLPPAAPGEKARVFAAAPPWEGFFAVAG